MDGPFIPYGPEGGYGGLVFRLDPPEPSYKVTRILIRAGDLIDKIKVEWKQGENMTWEGYTGGDGGTESVFELGSDEKIQEVKIYYESQVTAISIFTNNRTFTAGGGNRSQSVNYVIQNGEEFCGFIGRSGTYIDALGILTTIVDEKHTHKKTSGMGQDLKQLINDEQTSDIVLTSPVGRFAAHRVLLAARSPTFYDLIMNQKLKEIPLEIDDKRVLDCFLQYLYTDTVENADEDILSSLLKLSDFYQVPRLKVACGAYSMEKFTDENWLDILKFAVQYNEEELQDQVVKYIGGRIRDELLDYRTFYELDEDLFAALLESDEFPLDEAAVFKLVNDWIDYKLKNGYKEASTVQQGENAKIVDAKRLVKLIRLPLLDSTVLRRKIKNHAYVDLSDYVEAIEYSAMPQDFDPEFIARHKRFTPRKSITKFKWAISHNSVGTLVTLSDNERTVTKTGGSGWDAVVLSNVEFKTGVVYYEIEIVNVNGDKSGMVLGVTGDKTIAVGSFSSCYGLGMTGTPYNITGGGYNTHSFNNGDVFGTLVDFGKDDIKFYKNGTCIGRSTMKPSVMKSVYACVFLYYTNDRVTLLEKPRYPMNTLINTGY